MKPVLVSEERLTALYEQASEQQIPVDFGEFCTIARAALEELGVGTIETVTLQDEVNTGDCPFHGDDGCNLADGECAQTCEAGNGFAVECPLRKGAVLVRRKEPAQG